ncbi:hypothetical protein V8E54_004948 [Elaphomyces granulatus]
MKNQLLLIFAFFFIAALASPFEDVTNDLTKRQLSTCEGCRVWLSGSRKADKSLRFLTNKRLEWIVYGQLMYGWIKVLSFEWTVWLKKYLEWIGYECEYASILRECDYPNLEPINDWHG